MVRKAQFLALSAIGACALPLWGIEGFTRPDFEIQPLFSSPSLETEGGFSEASAHGSEVPFSITVNYSGDPVFEASFTAAAAAWEALIPHYIDGHQGAALFGGLTITASVVSIDGSGGILGSAGPTSGGTDDSGYVLATLGTMQFDADDFSSPTALFSEVVLHEMAHVIGVGTVWEHNNVYDPNAASVLDPVNGQTVGQYTGAGALAGWQMDYDDDATFVPIEKGGGTGTANGHFNEGDGGGATGYVSNLTGKDASFELMTGWLNPGSDIGNVTLGSLQDLGYDTTFQVPEPSAVMFGLLGISGFLLRRRRR